MYLSSPGQGKTYFRAEHFGTKMKKPPNPSGSPEPPNRLKPVQRF